MSVDFLNRMEQISMTSGLFALAYAIREKNEELMLQRANDSGCLPPGDNVLRTATGLFWIYLNRGEDSAVKELLNRADIQNNPGAAEHIKNLCSSFGILKKEKRMEEVAPEHKAFADYIRNKSIAVIGPSASSVDYTAEIKRDFDIIVRINYRGLDKLPEAQRGLAPQISYYKHSFFTDPDEDAGYLTDLRFAVLKFDIEYEYRKALAYADTRVRLYLPDFFFLGKFNMLQLALHDLLFFEPARIKVYNANCFLSDVLHDKGYYSHEISPLTLWRQNSSHNLISQYDYLRQLYKRGIIEADARLAGVLELGTAEYMNQMEKQESVKPI